MKQLPDNLASLAVARALRICGRDDMVDIEFEELDTVYTVRAPSPAEFASFYPNSTGATRAAADYCLLADCLVYPCNAKGEPDLDALRRDADALPALVREASNSVRDLAVPVPMQAVDITEATRPRAVSAIGEETLAKVTASHKRIKCVFLEDSKVKALLVRMPPRASWEAAQDADMSTLLDASNQLAIDCIASIEDSEKAALLAKYPGLGITLNPILANMAGSGVFRETPRKKARRVFSGS